MTDNLSLILDRYAALLERVDRWFAEAAAVRPDRIACGAGCSDCCRGLFDITLMDAFLLRRGFAAVTGSSRAGALARAEEIAAGLERKWPGFADPYILNFRPEEEWEELMPEDDETPCPLLAEGRCLVYDHRPMTCRLHGLPLVDVSGEIFHDGWCTLNWRRGDPLSLPALRGEFREIFGEENELFREMMRGLFGVRLGEMDVFIPTALLLSPERLQEAAARLAE